MCAVVLAAALVVPALTANAAPPARTPDIVRTTPQAVVSQPLAEVSRQYFERLKREGEKPGPIQFREVNPQNTEIPAPRLNAPAPSGQVDTVVQDQFGPLVMPVPTVNIEGLNSDDNASAFGFRVEPPDTEGAVGPDNYVEWINLLIEVYDKNGNSLAGPFPGNNLFTALGGTCASSNDGDPIVVYDKMAGRWLMSQFTGDNHQCIAVSTSSDPLGTFYLYDFNFSPAFPDYPKFGVWPDGYYYTARAFDPSFSGPIVGAFDRAAMLAGGAASFQGYFLDFYGSDYLYYAYVPINFEGTNDPPAGAPGLFGEYIDDADGIPAPHNVDGLQLLAMSIDWANPGNTTIGELAFLPVAAFDSNMCNNNRNCIKMLGTSEGVDALADRLMFQLKYRNLGDHQALLASHTVDATGTDVGGVRWYELRADAGDTNWSVYQQGTYAPDDNSRFMGDVQMDGSGNIMIGYTTSSATMYPSVRAAGRLAGDPLDHMSQGELNIVDGTGYKTSGYNRWGDYSSVSIDPADDCTFWFAQEYVKTTGSFQWSTQLTAVKFPTCGGPSGTVSGTVVSSATLDPIAGATVTFVGQPAAPNGTYSTTTNASGQYTIMLPVNTYDATASKFGWSEDTVTDIVVNEDDNLTQDFALDPVGLAQFDGYVTDAGHGWPLYAKVEISVQGAAPVATLYTNPFNGYYVTPDLPHSYNYEFVVTPMYPGYNPYSEVVMLPPVGMAKNFAFEPDGACTAPGYELVLGGVSYSENFNSGLPGTWTVVDNAGSCAWTDTNPGGRSNLTGGTGTFMIADSDWCYDPMNTDLISPAYDFTGASAATFTFKSDYNNLSSSESADVLISTDNGATWTLVNHWNTDVRGPYTFSQVVATNGSDQVKFKWHLVTPGWDWWWEVDDFAAEGAACLPIPGTLVGGFVNDVNTGMAINGATVESSTGPTTETMGTPNDPNIPDGFWWNFEPMPGLGPSTRTFTASAPNYASEEVEINLVPDTMNHIDFSLGAGWLEMMPTELISRLYPGEIEDQNMVVINHGSVEANVKMTTAPINLTWDHASPVKQNPHVDVPASFGRAPQINAPATPSGPSGLTLAGAPAYAVDVYPGYNMVYWPDVTAVASWSIIGGGMGSYFAGDFLLGDFSKLYILDYDYNDFAYLDTSNGAETIIGTATPSGGDTWSGMTGAGDGTIYASGTTCATSNLYTIDPGTGAATMIGPITNGACVIDIAINAAGELFGVDIINDVLLRIDTGTGAGTVVGPLGIDANYAQGLDFDEVTGTLYWASFNLGTFQGELRTIDTSTGASSLIGTFPGGAEVDAFGVATFAGGAGLPWLTLTPNEGVVPPGEGTMPITAEFIADGAPHYGLFKAKIGMIHDTPYDVQPGMAWFTKAFWDIPAGYWADPYIHALAGIRVTVGCGFGDFCPDQTLLRKHMSVFLERMMWGPDYMPPPAVGLFADVPIEDYNTIANYIEALYNDGVTAGCRIEDGKMYFCPDVAVARDQMAVFICRAKGWDPVDPPTGVFNDVPPDYWAAGYIEKLVEEEVTAGCGGGNYCPTTPINRAQIAVFLVKAWHVEYLMN